MHGGNALLAGVAEEDKPGSIQVFRPNFEKIYEVQAHSLPIERLRISFDNKFLFSVAQDGILAMFEIKVNEQSAGKKEKELIQIQMSEDIYLIQKAERDKLQADIEHLKTSIE